MSSRFTLKASRTLRWGGGGWPVLPRGRWQSVPRICPAALPGSRSSAAPSCGIQHPEAAASPRHRESGGLHRGLPAARSKRLLFLLPSVRSRSAVPRGVWSVVWSDGCKTSGGPGLSLPRPRSAPVQGPVLGGDGLFGVIPLLVLFSSQDCTPDFRVINALSKWGRLKSFRSRNASIACKRNVKCTYCIWQWGEREGTSTCNDQKVWSYKQNLRMEKTDLCRLGKSWSREGMGQPAAAERERSKFAWKFGIVNYVPVVLKCLIQTDAKLFISS